MGPSQVSGTSGHTSRAVILLRQRAIGIGMELDSGQEAISTQSNVLSKVIKVRSASSVSLSRSSRRIEFLKEGQADVAHSNLTIADPFLDGTVVELSVGIDSQEPWVTLRVTITVVRVFRISSNGITEV